LKWHWNQTMLNFCGIVVAILKMATDRNFSMYFYWSPFSKWPPQYHKNSTLSEITNIWYVGRSWCPELIPDIEKFNFCGIVVAILKMATDRNFSMSGINSGHHDLPTYQILMISEIWYVGR
jgi:hypothetical protein